MTGNGAPAYADVEERLGPNARARREQFGELVNAPRRLRGVREVDMVRENSGEPV